MYLSHDNFLAMKTKKREPARATSCTESIAISHVSILFGCLRNLFLPHSLPGRTHEVRLKNSA
jgi:hypothetical protein